MMYSSRAKSDKIRKSKKEKTLTKLIQDHSESEGEGSEHELSYYVKDRVKLMKEVLKIMKPKKIKMMAPEFMKNMQMEEINSMLLEELLGISNKRLRCIFDGKPLEEDSSSEEEEDNGDVISLDDISDGELIILDSDEEKGCKKHRRHHHHKRKIKEEPGTRKIKKEKPDKESGNSKTKNKGKEATRGSEKEPMGEENLMSVLELLELQARARAIRSQLVLEAEKKQQEAEQHRLAQEVKKHDEEDDDDEIIIEVPKNEEIVIPSGSESDGDVEFTKEVASQQGNNASLENTMENAPATAIDEEIVYEDAHSSVERQLNCLNPLGVVSSENDKQNEVAFDTNECINEKEEIGNDADSSDKISKPASKEYQDEITDKSGESSETAEIGDWGAQKSKLEQELARLEQENHRDLDLTHKEPEMSNIESTNQILNESSSEDETLAVIAERERRRLVKLRRKKDKREKRIRKFRKKHKHTKKDVNDEADIKNIELQSKEIETLMKNVEEKSREIQESIECESNDEHLENHSEPGGVGDQISEKHLELGSMNGQISEVTEVKDNPDSETEEGEVVTTSDESSESSGDEFKGTVDEYRHTREKANEKPNESSQEPSTSELLGENIPDLEQQKSEEKARKLREKRLRHMKGKLESFKKDMGTDSGSDKGSEKGVRIIESVVIKPAIKINSKSLKRKVDADDNDEIVINVDQDDLDCIICD